MPSRSLAEDVEALRVGPLAPYAADPAAIGVCLAEPTLATVIYPDPLPPVHLDLEARDLRRLRVAIERTAGLGETRSALLGSTYVSVERSGHFPFAPVEGRFLDRLVLARRPDPACYTLAFLAERGLLHPAVASTLTDAAADGVGVLFTGQVATGKTVLARAHVGTLAADHRVVAIDEPFAPAEGSPDGADAELPGVLAPFSPLVHRLAGLVLVRPGSDPSVAFEDALDRDPEVLVVATIRDGLVSEALRAHRDRGIALVGTVAAPDAEAGVTRVAALVREDERRAGEPFGLIRAAAQEAFRLAVVTERVRGPRFQARVLEIPRAARAWGAERCRTCSADHAA